MMKSRFGCGSPSHVEHQRREDKRRSCSSGGSVGSLGRSHCRDQWSFRTQSRQVPAPRSPACGKYVWYPVNSSVGSGIRCHFARREFLLRAIYFRQQQQTAFAWKLFTSYNKNKVCCLNIKTLDETASSSILRWT